MNAAFSEIQDGAFSHLPLLQFLYGQGFAEGQGWAGEGKDLRLGGGERRVVLSCLWRGAESSNLGKEGPGSTQKQRTGIFGARLGMDLCPLETPKNWVR